VSLLLLALLVLGVGEARGRVGGAAGVATGVPASVGYGRTVASIEHPAGVRFGVIVEAQFLKDEVRTSTEEGVGQKLRCDDRLHVAVTGIETPKHVQHLVGFRDRLADITKVVDEGLEMHHVVGDAQITFAKACRILS